MLLHGLPGQGRQWDRHRAVLGDRTVLCPTFAGFAPDEPAAPFPGTETHARQIVDWAAGTPPGDLVVVAWSFACHPLLYAMAHLAFRPTCAVLYDPGSDSYLADDQKAAHGASAGAVFGALFGGLASSSDAELVEMLFAATGDAGTLARLTADEQAIYRAGGPTVRAAFTTGTGPAPLAADNLSRITGTRLVVASGARSPAVFGLPARRVARLVPAATFHEIADADHMWPITDPAGFCRLVENAAAG